MIRRLFVSSLALIFTVFVVALVAQDWIQQNGAMVLRSGTSQPLMIVDQRGTGKIASFRYQGTEKFYISSTGAVVIGPTLAPVTPVDCTAPGFAFLGDTDTGIGYNVANAFYLCAGGAARLSIGTASIASSVTLYGPSSGAIGFPSSSLLVDVTDGVLLLRNVAGTGFSRMIFGTNDDNGIGITKTAASFDFTDGDGNAYVPVSAFQFYASRAAITVGSGTGITVNNPALLQRQVYKVTIDRTAFVSAATTSDITLATIPAGTTIVGVYANLTTTFACTATCTSSTLSMQLGTSAGGTQILASFDADAATATFGDTDAELGTVMARAAAVQGGAFVSFAGANAITLRLTSGTGNIGNGAATNLSQGTVTFYLVTERMP